MQKTPIIIWHGPSFVILSIHDINDIYNTLSQYHGMTNNLFSLVQASSTKSKDWTKAEL